MCTVHAGMFLYVAYVSGHQFIFTTILNIHYWGLLLLVQHVNKTLLGIVGKKSYVTGKYYDFESDHYKTGPLGERQRCYQARI